MARTQVAANFEEGVDGGAVDAEAADLHDLGMGTAGTVTYTSESHEGALAARIAPGILSLVTDQSLESARGGGLWFKVKAVSSPPTGSTEQIFRIEVTTGGDYYGIYMWRVGPNFVLYSQNGDVVVATLPIILDQWLYISIAPAGKWEFGDESGVILTGFEPTPSFSVPVFLFLEVAAYDNGITLVDDIWVSYGPPAIRLFPRDDGRGMSSASRIYPIPKGRSRVIGGYQ